MDYKNNIFILRNIHKSNDNELIDYTFEKILPKIFNYYKENRNKEIYNIDNCYKKYFPNLYLELLGIYNLTDLSKLIYRKNNYNKIEYIIKLLKEKNIKPYNQQQYGTFLVKNIIRSKRKLGLGAENHNKILSEELHKAKRKNYTRRKIIVNHIDEIFAADLVEMQKFAKLNKGYRYLLTCIDIFSKYSWVIPLKDKKGITIKNALQRIFKQRKPKFLWTDKGKEFYNKQVQDLLNENNIKLYSTNNSEIKSAVVERFNRTFKNMMYKKFTENNNTIFYNILDELVNNYNNKYHSTIRMTPIEGSKKINEKKIKNIYNFEKTKKLGKFKIGDRVRISLEKNIFEKGYETNWTQEIFVIYDIKYSNVPYYYLKDLNNEKLQGTFYEQEMQKTKQDDLYTIEKILKTNKDKIFVKWKGYDSSFNSWIDKNMVTKYL